MNLVSIYYEYYGFSQLLLDDIISPVDVSYYRFMLYYFFIVMSEL